MNELEKLAALDDQIADADQEDLEAIETLLEQRSQLLDEPPAAPEMEEPPEPEPQVLPPSIDPGPVDPEPEPEEMTLAEIKDEFLVRELAGYAKELRIKGYSGMNETELIKALLAAGWDPIAALTKRDS